MNEVYSTELTDADREELRLLALRTDEDIDLSDAPEQLDWSGARRGFAHGPDKQNLAVQLDREVVAWFRRGLAPGEHADTRMNLVLRDHMMRSLHPVDGSVDAAAD